MELHRHLEGAVRWQTVLDIARAHGFVDRFRADLPAREQIVVSRPMDDLQQVLNTFSTLQRCFVDFQATRRIAFEAVEDAARENVRLLELRLSPEYMARGAGVQPDALMEAVVQGVADACSRYPIVVGLVVIVSRSLGPECAPKVIDFARRWRDQLVGFDLADDEVRFPNQLFAPSVRGAVELGLGVTIHSGEGTPPSNIAACIEMGARRIGHGVTVAADPALLDRCIERGIVFEMCPTSNVLTRTVPSVGEHPLLDLLRRGLCVTVNSDDPGLFDIDLTHEMEALVGCGATEGTCNSSPETRCRGAS